MMMVPRNPRFDGYLKRRKTLPPARLYKYRSIEAALRILREGAVRWSAPKDFKDHLDCQWNPFAAVHSPEFMECHRNSVRRLLMGSIDWSRFKDPKVREALRRDRLRYAGLSAQARERIFERDFADLEQQNEQQRQRSQARADDLIGRLRVFCLCADPRSERMWDEYGGHHCGCVLGFDPLLLEKGWRVPAEPVIYGEKLPALLDVERFNRRLLGETVSNDPVEQEKMGRRWTLFKMREWEHELEWRFVALRDRGGYDGFKDYPFPPAAIIDIGFGRDCSPADEEAVKRAAGEFRARWRTGERR